MIVLVSPSFRHKKSHMHQVFPLFLHVVHDQCDNHLFWLNRAMLGYLIRHLLSDVLKLLLPLVNGECFLNMRTEHLSSMQVSFYIYESVVIGSMQRASLCFALFTYSLSG